MADLSAYQFKADLVRFAKGQDLNLASLVRRIAAELWNDIIEMTPVRTGRARSGWALAIDAPHGMVPEPVPEGTVLPKPDSPEWKQIDGTQRVYITNNVVYIEALEDGHSKQAPSGMVRVSMAMLEARIEAILKANEDVIL